MSMTQSLKARWKPEWSERSDLKQLAYWFDASLFQIDKLTARRAEVSAPGTLTKKGVDDAMRAFATTEVVPAVRRAAFEVEKAKANLKAQRDRLSVPKPDKADVAGAVMRAEIRSWLREMKLGERVAAVTSSPEVAMAAFEGPAALSGMTDQIREKVQKVIIEGLHADKLALIHDAEEAIELANAAVGVTTGALSRNSGFGESDPSFTKWLTGAAAEVDVKISGERASFRPISGFDTADPIEAMWNRLPTYRFVDGHLVPDGTLGDQRTAA